MRMRQLLAMAIVSGSLPLAAVAQTAAPGLVRVSVAGHDLFVPAGFTVSVFADNVGGVRSLALGPGEVVYAAQPGKRLIVRLPGRNHDGVLDTGLTLPRRLT